MLRFRPLYTLLALGLALGLSLAACDSADPGPSNASQGTATVETVEVGADEMDAAAGKSSDANLVLDDGTANISVRVFNSAGPDDSTIPFTVFNRFTLDPASYPGFLEEIHVFFRIGQNPNPPMGFYSGVGDPIELYVWEDTDGDGDPATGATLLSVTPATVTGEGFQVYALNEPVLLNGPGDVLIGVRYLTPFSLSTTAFPAIFDNTTIQNRTYFGDPYSFGTPYFEGNLMVRGVFSEVKRAIVGCNLGDTAQVLVPLSKDEAFLVEATIIQSTCVAPPNGKATERITARVPDNIPRPRKAVRVTGDDNPFFLINFDVTSNIFCGYDDDLDFPLTTDFTSQYMPSGIVTMDCRFPAGD